MTQVIEKSGKAAARFALVMVAVVSITSSPLAAQNRSGQQVGQDALRGMAQGAVIGAIAGNAGKGAVAGTAGSAIFGGAKRVAPNTRGGDIASGALKGAVIGGIAGNAGKGAAAGAIGGALFGGARRR
jgi:hypothetical protein